MEKATYDSKTKYFELIFKKKQWKLNYEKFGGSLELSLEKDPTTGYPLGYGFEE